MFNVIIRMKKINALELRHSLSKIIAKLQKDGEPILLEKSRKPAAVLISLEDYKKRFVEKAADEKRREIMGSILEMARPSAIEESSESTLKQIRNK